MTPDDLTRTPDPDATRDQSEAALDAGLAAAFGGDTTNVRTPSADPEAGTVIAGRYKLSERIGEGGMGSVWAAHQTEPVKRKVAVKLIKAGMDSKAVLARFEAERQALAVMDHPNIAKVLDGGLHDGRPYFVMELVKGVLITQFCDERKLTPQQRLELFVPVCQAIQHAHQKGVIHRDIKPSNVLVALYDDLPVPKVIDFGIAKATGGTLTDKTIETAFGGVIGTPQYMSPEQASLNNLDIDTRSDVYSLGVLLYELLTGSPPFAPKELEKRGLLEILRVVREEEPPRPSHKLSTADALPTLSANRGTEPKKLTGLLRNELDWIVMKALEKDRTRRYDTANGFAADVTRYLTGEPVQAHSPSLGYRLKKAYRRNKSAFVVATVVAVALLVAGLSAGVVISDRVRHAEQIEQDRLSREREFLGREVERLSQAPHTREGVSAATAALRALCDRTPHHPDDFRVCLSALFCEHQEVSRAGEDALVRNGQEAWPILLQALKDGTNGQVRRVALVLCRLDLEGFVTPEGATQVVRLLIRHYPEFQKARGLLGATQLSREEFEQIRRELLTEVPGAVGPDCMVATIRRLGRAGVQPVLEYQGDEASRLSAIYIAGLLDARYADQIIPKLVSIIRSFSKDSETGVASYRPNERQLFKKFRQAAMLALCNLGTEGKEAVLDVLSGYHDPSPLWEDARECLPHLIPPKK